jgi:hypothetical protein
MLADGFLADPELSTWENVQSIIYSNNSYSYFDRPSNMACHDITKSIRPPRGSKRLLGLGLNFSIKNTTPTNDYSKTIDRFKNDIRRMYFIENKDDDDDKRLYNPQLYIKSDWKPPAAHHEIEQAIENFSTELQAAAEKPRRRSQGTYQESNKTSSSTSDEMTN